MISYGTKEGWRGYSGHFSCMDTCFFSVQYLMEVIWGLPWWLSSKGSAHNAGDLGSIPGWGRSPGYPEVGLLDHMVALFLVF